jgi:hypothetical protein
MLPCGGLCAPVSRTEGTGPTTITNSVSNFSITIDGQFTGSSVVNGQFVMGQEWSDVTPLAFHTPTTATDTFHTTTVGAADANSLLYVALDPGVDQIYLMYDYLPRTIPTFAPGATEATITFPITQINPNGSQQLRLIDVLYNASPQGQGFNVLIRFDDTGVEVPVQDFGFEAAVGFGPSTLSITPHLLAELAVPLDLAPGFGSAGGPLPAGGELPPVNPGNGEQVGYSPDPRFWSADIANNTTDPPASGARFEILPNGATAASNVPEPTVQLSTGSETVAETAGTFALPVTLSAVSGVDTVIPFMLGGSAVAGTDFRAVTASPLVIPAGQTSATITGTLLDDGAPDATKTLTLTPGAPTNAVLGTTTTNTLTIADASSSHPPPITPTPPRLTGVQVERSGRQGKVTGLLLTFNEALDPGSAQTRSHYVLQLAGKGRKHHPLTVNLTGAVYDPAAHTVTLRLGKITVSKPSGTLLVQGITDPQGDVLQGIARFAVDLHPMPQRHR